jgi:hypothetical protein
MNVGLVDCCQALLVLFSGLLCSGAVLLLEVIDMHIHECRAGGLISGAVADGLLSAQLTGCFFWREYSVTPSRTTEIFYSFPSPCNYSTFRFLM